MWFHFLLLVGSVGLATWAYYSPDSYYIHALAAVVGAVVAGFMLGRSRSRVVRVEAALVIKKKPALRGRHHDTPVNYGIGKWI